MGKRTRLTLSKSGASVSERVGRVTLNSRGRVRVRIAPGISWQSSTKGCFSLLLAIASLATLVGHLISTDKTP